MHTTPFEKHLQEYALLICRALVDYPDDVKVLVLNKEVHTRVVICDYNDCEKGYLLGKDQRIFNAIRTCIQEYGRRLKGRVEVTLAEPIHDKPKKTHPEASKWTTDDNFRLALLSAQLLECLGHFTGQIAPKNEGDRTIITVKSECLTSEVFTAVSVIVKAAARMRGRKCDLRTA